MESEVEDVLAELGEDNFVREASHAYDGARKPRDFRDLRVFGAARAFVKRAYALSAGFPREERFGLTDQLRRAAVSIVANIAEGNGRRSTREYAHFLSISLGSARECQALLILAEDLGYAQSAESLHEDLDRLVGMLHRLREAVLLPKG